ncbi:hypothetical protein HZA73_11715 [candidate division TA06 bacterium]|nr:hypothetical protein [candidate division TA06 bacterium]
MKTLLNRALCLSLLLIAVFALVAGSAYARPSVENSGQNSGKVYNWKGLYKNNIMAGITNFGQLCQVEGGSNPFCFWPAPARDGNGDPIAPLMNYVFGWGLWVGGQVKTVRIIPGVTRDTLVTQGYNPSNSKYEYTPGGVVAGVPASPTSSAAKLYSSLEPGWAAKDGNSVVNSVEDTWCQYNDYNVNNHLTGRPLKIQVTQTTYQWNYPSNTDIIFFIFDVKNTGPDTIFDAYLAPTTDCDIGGEADPYQNDVCYWDSTTNMGYQYNSINSEPGWNQQPGCVGFMFLESPVPNKSFTAPDGWHIEPPAGPWDTLPDGSFKKIGLYAFKVFNRAIDPPTDVEQYQELAGYDYMTGIFKRLDSKPSPNDQRFMESTGPIDLYPGTSARTIVALICAKFDYSNLGVDDTLAIKELRQKAKTAKAIYDLGWLLPGPPKAPGLTVIAGNRKALISWDKSSWDLPDSSLTNPDSSLMNYDAGLKYYYRVVTKDTLDVSKFDPNYRKYSFEGIKLYKSLDGSAWQLMSQWDIANRFKVTKRGLEIMGPDTLFTGLTNYYQFNPAYIPSGTTGLFVSDQGLDSVFATNADNAGLSYSYNDENLINGNTYYYSVTAYGINFNSVKTTDSATNITSIVNKTGQYFETAISGNVRSVIPRTDPGDYVPSSWMVTANSGLSYGKSLFVTPSLDVPKLVKTASYKQVFGPVTRGAKGSNGWYIPQISYKVLDANDSIIIPLTTVSLTYDSTVVGWVKPAFLYSPSGNYITVKNQIANVTPSSFGIYKVEPWYRGTDTTWCYVSNDWRWAFRGSVLKIIWHVIKGGGDTLVSNDTLSCEVWDETNNTLIQSDTLSLGAITTSGWNFGATTAGTGRTIMSSASSFARKWMNVCGIRLYFNNPNKTGVGLNMTWATHPVEGEIWRIYPFGVTVPTEGEYQVISVKEASWTTVVDWARVKVVPNPYLVRNTWETSNERSKLQFINLPAKCTIKIFTIAGNLIKVLEHENDSQTTQGGTAWWDPMLTMNNQNIASGVYIYHVSAPGIGTHIGKFAVIK